jgi:hypothetical protein
MRLYSRTKRLRVRSRPRYTSPLGRAFFISSCATYVEICAVREVRKSHASRIRCNVELAFKIGEVRAFESLL